jgi:hypothetical protein
VAHLESTNGERGLVTDDPKQPWHKTLPGVLTAATGFIAALSGLVAGLNQLGVFRQEPPPSAVVGMSPTPSDKTAQDTSPARSGDLPPPSVVEPSPGSPSTPTSVPRPAEPAPRAAPRPTHPAPAADTATSSTAGRLAKGTVLQLTVPERTCAPEQGQRRFTARLTSPVRSSGGVVLPAGTTAVLHLRRAGTPAAPRARLDSLVRSGSALAIPSAQVQIPRGSVNGVCLRTDGRVSAVLGAGVSLPPR